MKKQKKFFYPILNIINPVSVCVSVASFDSVCWVHSIINWCKKKHPPSEWINRWKKMIFLIRVFLLLFGYLSVKIFSEIFQLFFIRLIWKFPFHLFFIIIIMWWFYFFFVWKIFLICSLSKKMDKHD